MTLSPSLISPMAIPATGALIGTPASIRDKVPPQTVAIDDEPLDSRMSDTILMVYGNSSLDGTMALRARSASAPWPTSRLPGPRRGLVSPTLKGGKL